MYQLNKENEAAKALGKFDWALTNILAEKEEAGELDEENQPVINA
ncbi:hypothetical protein [Halostagnicola sp. A56]|nr:hypothetical protein [Halostagnicola sp. A56]